MTTAASSNIVIVDYGTGNLNSVKRTLDRLEAHSLISSSPIDIAGSDKIILPGVGHFGTAMRKLSELNIIDALNEAVVVKRKPVLGICLGMQLMAKNSEEGGVSGLGWLDAQALRFDLSDQPRYKVPHMGWNQIRVKKKSLLMNGIDESAEFYFAHSYHLSVKDETDVLSETEYGIAFPSAIEKDNIFAVQYHPEKSQDAGVRLLKNFVEL